MISEALIIEYMKKLGLNEYETKAYLKLLEHYPLNGYTLSKTSGVPRSRIYDVLESLKSKQMVFEQMEGKITVYNPLNPRLLVDRLKNSYEQMLSEVEQYTDRLYTEEQANSKLTVIQGRDSAIELLNLLVANASKRIAVSIWEEELKDISEALDAALGKGVLLKGIYFGKSCSYEQLVTHRRIERYLAEKKERYMTVIVDGSQVLSGIISRGSESQLTWTRDIGIVEMSEDYISHDLMVNLYSKHLPEPERAIYEDFLDNARKEYFGFTEEEFVNFKNLYIERER